MRKLRKSVADSRNGRFLPQPGKHPRIAKWLLGADPNPCARFRWNIRCFRPGRALRFSGFQQKRGGSKHPFRRCFLLNRRQSQRWRIDSGSFPTRPGPGAPPPQECAAARTETDQPDSFSLRGSTPGARAQVDASEPSCGPTAPCRRSGAAGIPCYCPAASQGGAMPAHAPGRLPCVDCVACGSQACADRYRIDSQGDGHVETA